MVKRLFSLITFLTISHSVVLCSKFRVQEISRDNWDQVVAYLQEDHRSYGLDFEILKEVIFVKNYPQNITNLGKKYPLHLVEFHQELENPSITTLVGYCVFAIVDEKALFFEYATQNIKETKQELLTYLKKTYLVKKILYGHHLNNLDEKKQLFLEEYGFQLINQETAQKLLPDFPKSMLQNSQCYELNIIDDYDDDFLDEDAGLKICNFLKQNNNNNNNS